MHTSADYAAKDAAPYVAMGTYLSPRPPARPGPKRKRHLRMKELGLDPWQRPRSTRPVRRK